MINSKPKRILIFSFAYYPQSIGGAEVAIKEITDRLPQNDYEFDMVTLRKNSSAFEKIGNVNVYRVGSNKYFFTILGALKAFELHKKNKYDAIWSMMANYAGFAALFFKTKYPKVPFILSLQEGDPIDYIKRRVRFVYPIFKKIFTKADTIQTISNYLADFARDMSSFSSPSGQGKNIVVVPNGVNVKNFSSATPEFTKTTGDIFLITASRLVVKNAVSDIVKALKFLPENVKLFVCGEGYEEGNLLVLANNLSLGDRVIFKGFVPQENLPKYLKACDIFVRPSLSEGFGNSFIEAMAARIPVIATPVGGITDFLIDKRTGLFCGVSDPKDLALKVQIYLRDINLRNEIIDNAFEMVKEKYDWNLIAKDMKEKVFEKTIL